MPKLDLEVEVMPKNAEVVDYFPNAKYSIRDEKAVQICNFDITVESIIVYVN